MSLRASLRESLAAGNEAALCCNAGGIQPLLCTISLQINLSFPHFGGFCLGADGRTGSGCAGGAERSFEDSGRLTGALLGARPRSAAQPSTAQTRTFTGCIPALARALARLRSRPRSPVPGGRQPRRCRRPRAGERDGWCAARSLRQVRPCPEQPCTSR